MAATHGLSKTPEYKAWREMKQRCYNPKNPKYSTYGSEGIQVSNDWLNSFETFYSDLGQRPSPKHSLDRIDNDGDYCKENCRWATQSEQAVNRRTTILFEGMPLTEWAKLNNVKRTTAFQRFHTHGDPRKGRTRSGASA